MRPTTKLNFILTLLISFTNLTSSTRKPQPFNSVNSLKGIKLKVSVIGTAPYIMYGKEMTGVDIDLLNMLSKKFEFLYELKFERSWGTRNVKTGNWSGTISSVRKHQKSGAIVFFQDYLSGPKWKIRLRNWTFCFKS